MDNQTLIKTREYYDRTQAGENKKEVSMELFGKSPQVVERLPEYLAIVSAMNQVLKEELKTELEHTKRKQLKSYSKLLDKGDELIDNAKTTEEKIAAQANQRENLASGVIDNAVAWDSANRNQETMDILEGIIVN